MDWPTRIDTTRAALRTLHAAIPEAGKGFAALSKGAREGGVLGLKEKEHVALGIAIAIRCDDCIGFHVEALMGAGASREELADVLGMAVQMGGGPSLMYAAHALKCWDELAAAKG